MDSKGLSNLLSLIALHKSIKIQEPSKKISASLHRESLVLLQTHIVPHERLLKPFHLECSYISLVPIKGTYKKRYFLSYETSFINYVNVKNLEEENVIAGYSLQTTVDFLSHVNSQLMGKLIEPSGLIEPFHGKQICSKINGSSFLIGYTMLQSLSQLTRQTN